MKKQFITEAARLQKLAGIINESQYRELSENPDLKKYDGPTKIFNGIPHTWLGNGYFPSDQGGIDALKASFVQSEKDKVDKILKQQLAGKRGIKDNSKVKYFIANPNYDPAQDDYDTDNDDHKYEINIQGIVDAIKKYAAQNNLKINPESLAYYIEGLEGFGYDYGSGDFGDFERMGGYNRELTPMELYSEFLSITYDL
jgi:hypothetical protein